MGEHSSLEGGRFAGLKAPASWSTGKAVRWYGFLGLLGGTALGIVLWVSALIWNMVF